MELIQGTRKGSKFELEDFISNMPDNVVTNVLDRLPLQDAVRTGILSRNWRFKWTMLTQLVFDKNFFEYLLKTKNENSYGRIISRLLLHLKGAITKFVLYMNFTIKLEDEDINHWILFLSRNGIKDLTFCKGSCRSPLKLPTHLFSCLELKHLKLNNCRFDPPAGFNGFPKLLSLEINRANIPSSKFWKSISLCPSLEILKIQRGPVQVMMISMLSLGKLKLVEIAKLKTLKILSLSLCELENIKIANSSIVFELVSFLPKIQQLYLDFDKCVFTEDGAKMRPLTAFPSLEALKLSRIDLSTDIMLSCAFELIRCSPNLHTLEITTPDCDPGPPSAMPVPDVDYNTLKLLQLRRVVFRDLKGLENEVCLIKYILACSPFLKKIDIRPHAMLASGENLFSRKLLKLRRASPIAEIDLY